MIIIWDLLSLFYDWCVMRFRIYIQSPFFAQYLKNIISGIETLIPRKKTDSFVCMNLYNPIFSLHISYTTTEHTSHLKPLCSTCVTLPPRWTLSRPQDITWLRRAITHSITMGSMRTRNIVGTLHSYGAFVTVFRFGCFARGLKQPNSGVVRCLVALPHQIRTCDIIDFQERRLHAKNEYEDVKEPVKLMPTMLYCVTLTSARDRKLVVLMLEKSLFLTIL